MIWHVPPECQGQLVEVAYGSTRDGFVWRRTTDRSITPPVAYEVADSASCGCEDECDCWQPWNEEPFAYEWVPSDHGPSDD